MLIDAFHTDVVIYIIAYWRLATEFSCLCLNSETASHSSVFFASSICTCRDWSFNPGCGMTGIEDAYWSLGIPCKAGANNSLLSQHMQLHTRFYSCKVYKSLVLQVYVFNCLYHQRTQCQLYWTCVYLYKTMAPHKSHDNGWTKYDLLHHHIFLSLFRCYIIDNIICIASTL